MDNRTIDVTSEGEEGIQHALAIIWSNAIGGKATHYIIERYSKKALYSTVRFEPDPKGIDTLILLHGAEHNSKTLPFPLDMEQSAKFISDWLKTLDYRDEPDHDGSNGPGWRLFTEAWGHVFCMHRAIIAAQPAWAMYGK